MEPHSHGHHGTLQFPQAVVLALKDSFVSASEKAVTPTYTDVSPSLLSGRIKSSLRRLLVRLIPFAHRGDSSFGTYVVVGMVHLTAICGLGTVLWKWGKPKSKTAPGQADDSASIYSSDDAANSDPGLLKRFSTIQSYNVPSTGFVYPKIRTFYRPHNQQDKLPQTPCPIPLLVFIHGLGGSVAQFHPVLTSLVHLAPTLAIDLPGCGLSSFSPKSGKAYNPSALVHLLAVAIEAHRDHEAEQGVVLIGHSMGCSLAALLASSTSPHAELLSRHVQGLIAICPQAQPPQGEAAKALRIATLVPSPVFDLYRFMDKVGGVNSKSVVRMVGQNADDETKKLQLRFNQQSRTPVWQRMARGLLADHDGHSDFPGQETWAGLDIPVFLLAGEADTITPAHNVKTIIKFLGRDVDAVAAPSEEASLPVAAAPVDPAAIDTALAERKHQDSGIDASDLPRADKEAEDAVNSLLSSTGEASTSPDEGSITGESATIADTAASSAAPSQDVGTPSPHPRHFLVKTTIFPKPAAHSLLFAPSTSRILSGLIGTFLPEHVDPRLSPGWQLQYLATEGKWEVKNLEKWRSCLAVSPPLAGVFRPMKTLREVDEVHSPKAFVQQYSGQIRAVIDISHDQPVYDPEGLKVGGIKYYKFPTVSKLPPSTEEARDFIALVDKVEQDRDLDDTRLVGVHCHYGYNRTGFFLVCYLIERMGYTVKDAIEAFKASRPPGIKHAHFVDALYVKYGTEEGLKKLSI
ncbi:hypothetical protein K491DRAFT_630828 [Lophiostoma macrostomum CBS 122681]|uniref:Tyrosine specific protein phosphatases domain-containing protein n=1 Tax=Lophiostoma macrostomum CBS 122681 TaxID=1314788 RepID=A0A6A6T4Z5_9PLEO|nr:hypothetical protein K491DRAFT_630828 [Lophiostoma macrostomum CBS 122681]